MTLPRLLLVADFCVHSGFSRVAESLAKHLADRWEIHVIALNYFGDPHPLAQQFRVYPAGSGGDPLGAGRLNELVNRLQPSRVLIINDPWVCPAYLQMMAAADLTRLMMRLGKGRVRWWELPLDQRKDEDFVFDDLVRWLGCGGPKPPVVLYMPVDGAWLKPNYVQSLNQARHAIAYTEYGRRELQTAGLKIPCEVIPHGIDLDVWRPVAKAEARSNLGLNQEDYIVAFIDRNQARKQPELAIEAFARWVGENDLPPRVKLLLHCHLRDVGPDLLHLANRHGIDERVIVSDDYQNAMSGVPEQILAQVYSACDVRLSTTGGEGWGLITMEAMACGLPNIVPRWSALAEWAEGAVEYAEIAGTAAAPAVAGHLYGTVDVRSVVARLDLLYHEPDWRAKLAELGRELVERPCFRWAAIADRFHEILQAAGDG